MQDVDTPLPHDISQPLARTRPWMKFVAIMGFIGTGFAVLGALMLVTAPPFANLPRKADGAPVAIFVFAGIMELLLAALYFVPSFLLYRYAGSLDNIEERGCMGSLVGALNSQRQFWKYVGICIIVSICLWFVGVIAVLVVGLTAAAMHMH